MVIMSVIEEKVTLSNGYPMPKMAFGTYNLDKKNVETIIGSALKVGFRHFETAPIYLNEEAIGNAIRKSNVDRNDIFITSKVPPHIKSYDATIRMAKKTMNKLGVDYIDALIINNPVPWGKEGQDFTEENREVWRAMEDMYTEEIIGAIGLSNFDIDDMNALMSAARIKPHINQLGIFAGHTLDNIRTFCEDNDITVQGHSPLARGRLLKEDRIINLAKKENLSPAQLALRFVYELNVCPVVKSNSLKRMRENIDINKPLSNDIIQVLMNREKDVRDYKPPKAKKIL
jgi:diketogulonate reductase-like aldo/keto reductase